MTTLFSRIIAGELPCEKVYEDDLMIAIKDIDPQAPVHLLLIPKKEIANLQSIEDKDEALLGHMLAQVPRLAEQMEIEETGYRVVINNGDDGKQTIDHLHIHLLGGCSLSASLS